MVSVTSPSLVDVHLYLPGQGDVGRLQSRVDEVVHARLENMPQIQMDMIHGVIGEVY